MRTWLHYHTHCTNYRETIILLQALPAEELLRENLWVLFGIVVDSPAQQTGGDAKIRPRQGQMNYLNVCAFGG